MKKWTFPVEAGHIMQFARAVGDPNPVYSDAASAADSADSEIHSVIAPPTFTAASAHFDPDYTLRPKLGEPWFGSGRQPSGAHREGGGLHGEQHYEYHRPLRAGEVLHAEMREGDTWEKQGRRGGKLVFTERITELRDGRGDLVVTERSVSVRTGRVVESSEGGEDS